jgi:hypothetical protein
MSSANRRIARLVIPGLCAGGACGAGIGLGLYPAAVGIAASIAVAALVGLGVYRSRASRSTD